MEDNQEQPRDPQEPTDTKPAEAPIPEDGSEREKPVEEATTGGEKEEEEAFLVSLYKFMKDRHTPIERIPHLGFKQINLWKIYKAVEKLGAYELVTGRRLWKNVYDELGGSPGSTSAATCTRRHYERLVLPYVRHLKGEDDKPLPPSKPRKQYKVSKGTETGEKSKRAKKEKGREQMPPDKAKPEVAAGTEDTRDAPERGRAAEGCSSPVVPTPSPLEGCPGPCRTHPETYKRLFSSFYSKGNHPIMSPLAKKKLLAQVSKAESLPCHKRHHPEGRQPASDAGPEPPRPATGPHLNEQRSPEPSGAQDTAPSVGNEVGPITGEVGPITSASPGGRDSQHCPRAEDGCPAPAVFTGCFHAYRNEVLKPVGRHPLWGYFSSLKDFLEPPSTFPSRAEEPEQPQDLRSKAGQPWGGESRRAGARATVRACWVPPGAAFAPAAPRAKHGREEEAAFAPSAKLRAISPFLTEADGGDTGTGSPGGQQGLAKPKAVVASPGYAAPLPQAPDVYKGAMLHFPASFGSPLEHLKTQGVPAAPSLSVNPFIIPAFPSPLVATSTQPSDLCRPLATGPGHYPAASYESSLRHRLYPAATWHTPATYTSPRVPAFHRHAKL
ncbi:LOW QUALITY PROTEIN: AT-rich interactive domain-containing protein 5A [Falco peregrinus]|uniref:LOW QUALITY PROTEIN: AT-rich interactive domain-containing protein 5A n=1 Tax=Falco peregrinus TaxID=8954 RepID=UPI00247A0C7B|nr:LOW QUALITY PROTEIN: AT-rich interactive domain-containing protein 5A [Falco peregrinus]